MTTDLGERLAELTLELVNLPSVSRDEAGALRRIRDLVPQGHLELVDDQDSVLFYLPRAVRPEARSVLLAGHVDTVPVAGNLPGRRLDGAVVGCGASDMKGALSVMLAIAGEIEAGGLVTDLDVGFLFFGREEIPIAESALLPLLWRCPRAAASDLVIVMEPTDNAIELGCLGNMTARVTVRGRAAHSARPWLGSNAIHAALRALEPLADLPIRDVEVDGLIFKEVISVTSIVGGTAANVVPDLVQALVNFRYAPTQTPVGAEARLRELFAGHQLEIEVLGNAPPAPVTLHNALVERLRRSGDLRVGPKQAWTPVAEFAAAGVDAVNFGPGDPRYAHRGDEMVRTDALVLSYETLRSFLSEEGSG